MRVNAAHDVERDLREARVFHVNAHKTLRGAGMLDEIFGDGLGEFEETAPDPSA